MNISKINKNDPIDIDFNIESIERLIRAKFQEYPKYVQSLLCKGVIYGGSLLAYGTGNVPNDVDIMLPNISLKKINNIKMKVLHSKLPYFLVIWKREKRLREKFKPQSITLKDDEKIEDFQKRLENYLSNIENFICGIKTIKQKHYCINIGDIPQIDTAVCLEDSPIDVILHDTIPFFTIGGLYAESKYIFEGKSFLKSRLPDVSVLEIFKDYEMRVLRPVKPINELLSSNEINVSQFIYRAQKYYFYRIFKTFSFSRITCQLIAPNLDKMYKKCLYYGYETLSFYKDLTNYIIRQILEDLGFTDGPLQLIIMYSQKWNSYYDIEERHFLEKILDIRKKIQHGKTRINHYTNNIRILEEELNVVQGF